MFQNKFSSLALAFKTDRLTLQERLDVQRRHRDQAEYNLELETQRFRDQLMVSSALWWSAVSCVGQWCSVMVSSALWWSVVTCDCHSTVMVITLWWWSVVFCDCQSEWCPVIVSVSCDSQYYSVIVSSVLWGSVVPCEGQWRLEMATCDPGSRLKWSVVSSDIGIT